MRRWTLEGATNEQTSTSAIVTRVDGPWVSAGERIEVVEAAPHARAVAERIAAALRERPERDEVGYRETNAELADFIESLSDEDCAS